MLDAMEFAQCTPSLSQALRIKKLSADVTNRHYQGGFPQTVRRECVGGRGIR